MLIGGRHEGGMEVELQSFLILALHGEWAINATPRLLSPPQKGPPSLIVLKAGWTAGPV